MAGTSLKRVVRTSPFVERLAALVKRTPRIELAAIGFGIDVKPGDIVIDCGANVGDVTSKFARTGAVVHAFEPSPRCFDVLRRRFAFSPNVTLHNQGVMAEAQTLTLRAPKAHAGFSDLEATVAATFVEGALDVGAYELEETSVACIDFPAFVRSLGHVRLIKMDIEGAEVALLNAMIDQGTIDAVDMIVVETHERMSEELSRTTEALRERIIAAGLGEKVRLDWI